MPLRKKPKAAERERSCCGTGKPRAQGQAGYARRIGATQLQNTFCPRTVALRAAGEPKTKEAETLEA